MKFSQTYSLYQIASIINAKFVGEADFPVNGMNEIHVVTAGDIVFVDHPKYYDKALQSAATIVLINKEVNCPEGKALLISDDPFRDFNKLTDYFKPFQASFQNVSLSAEVGENTIIQPNSFIGNHVKIGKNCVIHSNVSIYDHTVIGDHVTIHAGTVLGASAFYYKKRTDGFDQLQSGGRVVIKNHVDIGAACTIDRGVSGDTTIKSGTKIDNQVHIGHDTVIGEKCLIASQVGIAGCVILEDEVTLWGQVGIRSDVKLAKGSEVFAQSGVGKNLKANTQYFGSPATEAKKWFKEAAAIRQLPSMLNKKPE
ncbi:UDP-3-O-(3-hydroxymyristoyl)glucosamine N-acyltransferase [Mesonia aestuariivivens]|uniref:UDP-3-O-(3-hydroxymyristoyl)glucosamine N-acyltransferase n=1 Tax=Mesonia aestuariivivens TaxID=2796128 RepID=A0ABS6W4M3_9FLAO|nr:UDP-3-O-(3-hydroxymyristoyl)glucosamine N-acyltransferase [Mesonia aestuariivivens]MBW2962769.1 UDP-3-O-(3-hydroxymyristoyl)glucosamine N-acyltransferase [Mesonia aestuariivivens]